MGLFFPDDEKRFTGVRATGFPRYKELLEHNLKEFFLVGFITLVFLIPYGLGMVAAITTQSSLVMLAAGVIGGGIAGPGVACMYDIILRRLRDNRDDWWSCYKRSMGQNWKASIIPGMIQGVFWGFLMFSCALLLWAKAPISLGTLLLLLFSAIIFMAIVSIWWPQIVLFEQKMGVQIKNAVGFTVFHLGRCLGVAVLQVAWWIVTFLFLPWSAFLVPFLSVWYILFLAMFILYRPLDRAFHIEEQINEHFPGQIQIGEDE